MTLLAIQTSRESRLKELIANNKLLKEDEFERPKIQEKINKLVRSRPSRLPTPPNKAPERQDQGRQVSRKQSRRVSQECRRRPQGSQLGPFRPERKTPHVPATGQSGSYRCPPGDPDKEKLTASQRTNIEQRIHSLVQKKKAGSRSSSSTIGPRLRRRPPRRRLQKKANDLRDAQKANLEARQAAAERDIEQAKKAVAEGTADPGAVDAAINARQPSLRSYSSSIKRMRMPRPTGGQSPLNAETADIQIQQSRLRPRMPSGSTTTPLRSRLRSRRKPQETVQAVQQQVTAQKSAIQSLEDIQQQQSASFGIDAVRAQADAIDQRIEKEAAHANSHSRRPTQRPLGRRLRWIGSRRGSSQEAVRRQWWPSPYRRQQGACGRHHSQSDQEVTPANHNANTGQVCCQPYKRDASDSTAGHQGATQMASAAPQTKVDVHVAVTVKDTKAMCCHRMDRRGHHWWQGL